MADRAYKNSVRDGVRVKEDQEQSPRGEDKAREERRSGAAYLVEIGDALADSIRAMILRGGEEDPSGPLSTRL